MLGFLQAGIGGTVDLKKQLNRSGVKRSLLELEI